MNMKIILSAISFFLIFSGNASAVSIIPIQEEDKNAFQMTLDFVKENPDYQMLIMSDNHLFRGNYNKILACKYNSDGTTELYNVYFDATYYKIDESCFFHVFEHGQERQKWSFLTENVLWMKC